jgi:hypothetical protein
VAKRADAAEEAILLASPGPDVRAYLKQRAASASEEGWPAISKETEEELLKRGDRLIDLTLAEYCLFPQTARCLFERDPEDWAVRSLVLGNEAMAAAAIFESMPKGLMGGEEGLLSFLSSCTKEEAWILFANPTLHDGFLEKFLGLEEHWQVMREDVRLAALAALARNSKMRRTPDNEKFHSGFSWYMAGRPLAEAWRLIERLEPSDEVAWHLAPLYAEMGVQNHKTDDTLAALQKWIATSEKAVADEVKSNASGYLSPHQQIRHAAACMLIANREATKEQFIVSDDIALRCAAYQRGKIELAEMKASVERDGALAVRHLIYNLSNWKNADHRDELESLVQSVDEETLGWEYSHRYALYLKEHPDWFDGEELPKEPDERPLTESSIADVVGGVVQGVATVPAFTAQSAAIEKLAQAQRYQFWLLLAALAALLLRH